jgi:CRISPR-associated protein Cmr4
MYQLILEAFEFAAEVDDKLKAIAEWIATHALPGAVNAFFANKLKTDLVLLHDTDFAHFARHAMVVEPHVCIDDESGTAKDGGLFYVENLPPETLMVGLVQASIERFKKDSRSKESTPLLTASEVLSKVFEGVGDALPGIGGRLLQIGGDATTGRGLVLVQSVQR